MPILPSSQALESHGACIAALERQYAEDRRAVVRKAIEADGATREVALQTSGIRRTGPDYARYEATFWHHHGRVHAELERIETSHSFESRISECKGAMLHVSGETGYTLSTFEPWKKSAP